MLSLSCRCC
uniref:Uncharacterized protein n=1 Tax=Rhizophora mucronata TaxID=61149 RepID=A0A2P2NIE2_RHIMU